MLTGLQARRSMNTAAACLALCLRAHGQPPEQARWTAESKAVTITRDDRGIAHIHGRTDADAVFGMIYAQCEDDFNRIERNYLTSLGRAAEADGEKALWADLRQRLWIDPDELKREYAASPGWLQRLMIAWADGINFYLSRHKDVKPQVLTHWEPWMALSFTEGSIGGDIEKVGLKGLEEFYTVPGIGSETHARPAVIDRFGRDQAAGVQSSGTSVENEPGGSNGIAIAPKLTKNGHALLLINPHTPFFFRSEAQVTSDEGLNAYGAATWGQFFVYQGFNDRIGWMHTSSAVDAVDEFLEKVTGGPGSMSYQYGDAARPTQVRNITLRYKEGAVLKERTFKTYATQHGPVVRKEGDRWVAVQLMNTPVKALEQSWLRTRAHNYAGYSKTMELMANSSNNTVYADADGTIAYWHGDFIPRRDTRFDYTKPVDGSDPATNWSGLHPLSEVPQLKDPVTGWLFNVNDSPWNGAGASSLKRADFPAYVEQGVESARGLHALKLLNGSSGWTVESLRTAAYDSYLPWFAQTVPALTKAWDDLADHDEPLKASLASQIALLRRWNDRWGADSVATTLAVYWGTELLRTAAPAARAAHVPSEEYVARLPPRELLQALAAANQKLSSDFGTWRMPWGEVNRFQRITGDIQQPFTDAGPSIPVPFTASTWGSLAAFGARQWPGTKKWYGTLGNSFVAIVEFGPKVHAVAITAGGESGHPGDRHFNDEAHRYVEGNLREVYFYPEQLKGHTERVYRPGQ